MKLTFLLLDWAVVPSQPRTSRETRAEQNSKVKPLLAVYIWHRNRSGLERRTGCTFKTFFWNKARFFFFHSVKRTAYCDRRRSFASSNFNDFVFVPALSRWNAKQSATIPIRRETMPVIFLPISFTTTPHNLAQLPLCNFRSKDSAVRTW